MPVMLAGPASEVTTGKPCRGVLTERHRDGGRRSLRPPRTAQDLRVPQREPRVAVALRVERQRTTSNGARLVPLPVRCAVARLPPARRQTPNRPEPAFASGHPGCPSRALNVPNRGYIRVTTCPCLSYDTGPGFSRSQRLFAATVQCGSWHTTT